MPGEGDNVVQSHSVDVQCLRRVGSNSAIWDFLIGCPSRPIGSNIIRSTTTTVIGFDSTATVGRSLTGAITARSGHDDSAAKRIRRILATNSVRSISLTCGE